MRALGYTAFILVALFLGIIGWMTIEFSGAGPLAEPVTIVIPPNTHFTAIVEMLAQNKIIRHPLFFEITEFLRGDSSRFKAGEYMFPAHVSSSTVSTMLANGKTVVHHLTVAEGLMTSEIIELVKRTPELDGEITLDLHEGELLPQTYNFSRGDKRNDMVERMRHAMQKTLAEAWEGRASNLPFSNPAQALILASIVEKETGLAIERGHVAAVYINRLRRGMRLQADPTTAYAVTHGAHKMSRPLTMKDLEMDSPYNTYRYVGLPPGAIANPGKASLLATLHPDISDDLYFVATGMGGHNFARTAEQHAINVQRYRQMKKGN